METRSDQAKAPRESLDAGLLIVTGASHTGKSSVIEAILPTLEPPVALLGVDSILTANLIRPPGERWEQIPLAYDLIERQADALLGQGWLVVVESTFTYVPPDGEPIFHSDALERLLGISERHGASSLICRIDAPLGLILERATATNRLPQGIVESIAKLHEACELPAAVRLSTANREPSEVADDLRRHLARDSPGDDRHY